MTERVGLIGWPVEHSVSPAMHNATFEALGLDWRYDLLPVRPGELGRDLRAFVEQGYRGFNVTVPHKVEALALAQNVDAAAEAIGAANTFVVREGGGLWAVNTDAPGLWRDLNERAVAQPPAEALILGTGGSARAVAYALLTGGWRVRVLSRELERAGAFAREFAAVGTIAPLQRGNLRSHVAESALIVNCTPVGMWPHAAASPWPDDVSIPSGTTVYDLVYNPPRTVLMAQAEAAGARAIGGLGMLVWQGALAFELWTGQEPPLDVMRAAAERALAGVR